MADKSFGVKELNLLNASGTPTVTSPNNLNLNANTVAISTSATVGNNLTVSGQINVGSNIKIGNAGVITATSYRGDGSQLTGISGISTDPSNVQATWKLGGGSGSGFTFTGPGQDGSEGNPDIYLVRGQRYLFDNTALAGNHPFEFRNAANDADYTDGVSGAQNGLQYINVQHDAPAQLKYRCTIHNNSMLGNIYIVGQHLANGVNNRVLTATSAYGMNGEANLTFDGTNLDIDSDSGKLRIGDDQDLQLYHTAGDSYIRNTGGFLSFGCTNNADLKIVTNNTERMLVSNGGNVSIGGMAVNSFSNYRTLTIGGAGAVDGSGIDLERSDGTIYGRLFGDANGLQIGAPASGDYIRFETQNTERVRIDSSGNFAVGNRVGTSFVSSNQPVAFHSARVSPDGNPRRVSTGQRCNLFVGSNSGWAGGDGGVLGLGGSETGGAGVEAMWSYIKGSRQSANGWEYAGYFELGTSPWSGLNMAKRVKIWADGQIEIYPTDNTFFSTQIGGAQRLIMEHTGGGNIRMRNTSSGSVTYSTSSDYRLKEKVTTINNALTTVKALKPYQFTWKHDSKLGQGFFAHEAQAVLPDIGVVSGTKDAVHTEDPVKDEHHTKGDPIYQSVDYSKLVPLLTASIKELIAKVESLEEQNIALRARVTNLEGN